MAPGGEITADIRNGENFEGSALAWIDRNVARSDLATGARQTRITGRLGDRPALRIDAPEDGLAVVIHETTPSRLTYQTWEKFQRFVDHKDLGVTQADHLSRGHPPTGFTESYTRHTKALIALGDGAGADRAFGLQTELIAFANPYTPDYEQILPVQLNYQGRPRGDTQIEIFDRGPDGVVAVSTVRTDAAGRAEIPTRPGHSYLLDAVILRPGSQGNAVYDTLWAGMSFHVPQ